MSASPSLLCCVVSIVAVVFGASSSNGAPSADLPIRTQDIDNSTWVETDSLEMVLTNRGSFAYDVEAGNGGFVFPRGTNNRALFAAGIFIGGKPEGEELPRVTVAEYSSEFAGGRIEADGSWDENWAQNQQWRTYQIEPGDTPTSNPDYRDWPVEDGAPVDEFGQPRHLGDQTCWAVFHDADPSWHTNDAGASVPLGVEVQQTTFVRSEPGLQNVVFLEWKVIHKGEAVLDSVFLTAWCDPDLGQSDDDLVGCDLDLELGYVYNGDDFDDLYEEFPPAAGVQLLQGPIVPAPGEEAYVSGRIVPDHRNLPLSAFIRYSNGFDPHTPLESYNYMQGLEADGSPIIDPTTGEPTRFAVTGDPVTGTGWIDTEPGDRRFMVNSGPFTMAPGDTQTVAYAVVAAQGADRLDSITALRRQAGDSVRLFRAIVGGQDGACCAPDGTCLVLPETDCEGVFFVGRTCDPDPCYVSGACCSTDGTCTLTREDECDGSYQGDEWPCTPLVCEDPLVGACCTGDDCTLTFLDQCDGVFQGVGTECQPTSCSGTVWEWEPEPRWLRGYPYALSAFDGGIGLGYESFFGSELERSEVSDIEIRFTDEESEWSYCQTYRRDLDYALGGIGTFPGSAWDVSDPSQPRRININFVEDDSWQPANQRWDPNGDFFGGLEFAFFMKSDYDGGQSYGDGTVLPDGRNSDVMFFAWTVVKERHEFLETTPSYLRLIVGDLADPFGACCLQGQVCVLTRRSECDGAYQGDSSVCDPEIPCPFSVGACCLPLGQCQITGELDCPGRFLGAETSCEPNVCPPPGACCTSDGRCVIIDGILCAELFKGDGTTCDPFPCPPVGACCLEDGECRLTRSESCRGEYLGDGSSCQPNPCAPGVTDVATELSTPKFYISNNPTDSPVDIHFNLERPASIELEIFDAAGRIQWRHRHEAPIGVYVARWALEGADAGLVPQGKYFLRARIGDEGGWTERTQTIVVVR